MVQQFMQSDARKEAVAREVVAIAREINRSPAQVALAWLRQRSQLVIPIIGARKLAQVKGNLASIDAKLASTQIDRLDAVSQIELGFPRDMFTKDMVRSLTSGGMRDQIDA
jgi:aryl-alcohol dehydrogenase-like predicted oxidoreductase